MRGFAAAACKFPDPASLSTDVTRARARRILLGLALAGLSAAAPAAAAVPSPALIRDVRTGMDPLGSLTPATPDPIQDYVQPDTQIEPSIAVNPANPLNVVTAYQEGRIADGGDATQGFATSFDGGATWTQGELPGLTTYPGQGGVFERASDAVVAFGPNNTVYANSLVFDMNTDNGLRSGMAVNVSKDGGRTWSKPVIIQDDQLGGLNDKNWIVVDNSDAPGHHKGRVYVVWDRVAPVVYDYCDQNCDQLGNWLPNLQTVPGLVFPGQGIGAYPLVLKSGGLGIVIQTTNPGIPTSPPTPDEPEAGSGGSQVFISAPAAGSTPYPAPLAFMPPINIGANLSAGTPAQRASDGLPAAAVDPVSGAVYAVWDDGRFRTDGVNDAVISKSTDEGMTWSPLTRVNPGPKTDKVNHYNITVAVGMDGAVHVAYRQRDQSGASPLFTPVINTFYQESRDGGKSFSAPLALNTVPSNAYYDAFSRNGSFEGDYNQTASAGGYTYIVREQGQPAFAGEPPALTPNSSTTVALAEAGKGHQHQRTWVALVREIASLAPGSATTPTGTGTGTGAGTSLAALLPGKRPCASRRNFVIRLVRPRRRGERLVSAVVTVNGRTVAVRRGRRLHSTIDLRGLPLGRIVVRIVARTNRGHRLVSTRAYRTCTPSRRARHR
jgi:hypothetical protein